MKHTAKSKAQQANEALPAEKSKASLSNSWEMTAQEALRVDYLTGAKKF